MSDPNREEAAPGEPGADGTRPTGDAQGSSPAESPKDSRAESDNDAIHDPMAPPAEPCECFCLHCGRTFTSDRMWFQRVVGARDGFPGFWMCPTPNCSGAGFTFDIFPTDPSHPANDGWVDTDEESDDPGESPEGGGEYAPEQDIPWDDDDEGTASAGGEWDADESKYKAMDEWDDEDDDLEGEEWKHGLAPGERPRVQPPPPGVEPRTQEEEEALYDEPDRRPRELDWSHRDDRPEPRRGGEDDYREDDIPF